MRPAGRVTNAPRRVGEMRPVNLLAVGGEYYIARRLHDQGLYCEVCSTQPLVCNAHLPAKHVDITGTTCDVTGTVATAHRVAVSFGGVLRNRPATGVSISGLWHKLCTCPTTTRGHTVGAWQAIPHLSCIAAYSDRGQASRVWLSSTA
jgi:hypothetical protein